MQVVKIDLKPRKVTDLHRSILSIPGPPTEAPLHMAGRGLPKAWFAMELAPGTIAGQAGAAMEEEEASKLW